MTEASPEDAAAQRAAEQVRLRKAKREAKIRAGGASRLNKITGLGGGFQRAPSATSGLPKPNSSPEHADPEEIDISQHYYEPAATPRPSATGPPLDPNAMTEDQLRQMMLGFDRSGPAAQVGPRP
ncbi:uncharacterized protein ColSpa_07119 [Colletotrichum spaethianum]|uniref:Uncharacterized protein n=1 Tax=Colletotrichum spaethianum TaxID=700344 RepID=A0AA37LI31_9PEZI|nr:uncharacterized protein ColSpa_07119 [Colletotrichum spaethianum]GKT46938.1 hypothetical protein ColSpa_07119 [Colletotrichum spaethianum]